MSIGYASKVLGVTGTDMRSCILKNATEENLMQIIMHNINSLNCIIDYNIENKISLFRISSDLIPFGSSDINKIKWWKYFKEEMKSIGQKIKSSNMRVSLHPGQYTVLNSVKMDVVKKAMDDLGYHTRILDSLGLDSTHKIVLHIGGAYNDKKASGKRFLENYKMLDECIKKRLVIENDDKIYNIQEVLEIGIQANIPVIFDNLHNEINPSDEGKDQFDWIERCKNTWQKQDGNQKIHYSQQSKHKKKGSHSAFISISEFMDFYKNLNRNDIDIMLEVKDKNLSCVKCINCTTDELKDEVLEKEWSKYKYTVLERSLPSYTVIKNMFKGKKHVSAVSFYRLIEKSLETQGDIASYTKAIEHVWEHLYDMATEKEKNTFYKNFDKYQQQQLGIKIIKNQLKKLTIKYKKDLLINSYYFLELGI